MLSPKILVFVHVAQYVFEWYSVSLVVLFEWQLRFEVVINLMQLGFVLQFVVLMLVRSSVEELERELEFEHSSLVVQVWMVLDGQHHSWKNLATTWASSRAVWRGDRPASRHAKYRRMWHHDMCTYRHACSDCQIVQLQ